MIESAASRGRIFISYRREETAYPAGWLFDRLAEHFGSDQVFKDVDSIDPGDDFVQTINRAVASCDVLLALIGNEWLTIRDEHDRRRLDIPEDFVRLEIEAALTRNIRVVPILVDKARMPGVDDLPASLAGLVRRQALELSSSRFNYDSNWLVKVLKTTLADVRTVQMDNAAIPVSPRKSRGHEAEEASHEPDRAKSTTWRVNTVSRSRVEAVFRLHSGSRQHFIHIKNKRGDNIVISMDSQPGIEKFNLKEATFQASGEGGDIQVNVRLTKSRMTAVEIAAGVFIGLTYGLVRRIGPVRITVDDVLVYED